MATNPNSTKTPDHVRSMLSATVRNNISLCTIITTPVTWVVNLYTYEAQQEEYVQYNYASYKLISRLQSSEYSHIN